MTPYNAAYRGSSLLHKSGVVPVVITDSCSSAAVSHCLLICFSQCDTQDRVNNSAGLQAHVQRDPTPTAFFFFIHSGTHSSIKNHHPPAAPVSVDLSGTFIFYVSLQH